MFQCSLACGVCVCVFVEVCVRVSVCATHSLNILPTMQSATVVHCRVAAVAFTWKQTRPVSLKQGFLLRREKFSTLLPVYLSVKVTI